ncbi:hypothetical protein DRO49_02530 [Candidatus Bathyarchaeota archaeon]|nr:MAG: hypothetical protein DRO49_02530 [Candidatus Bathyarchaeota archaeon]
MSQFEILTPCSTLVRIIGDKDIFEKSVDYLIEERLIERRGNYFRAAYHADKCRRLVEMLMAFGFDELELYRNLVMNMHDIELHELINFLLILTLWKNAIAKNLLSDIELRECIMNSLRNRKNANLFFKYGIILSFIEMYENALECFEEATDIKLDFEEAWVNKGETLRRLGRYNEAIECFNKAIEINPECEEAWYNKGVALDDLGKHHEAIKCYDKVIEEINPESEEAWYNKGITLVKLGKYKEAIECFERTIEKNPKDEGAWINKGAALIVLGKPEKAVECFDEVIYKINPESEEAWVNKGVSLFNLGRYEEAIACYDRVIRKINPESEKAWLNKGIALGMRCHRFVEEDLMEEAEKCIKQALECFKKAIQIDPQDIDALKNMLIALFDLRRILVSLDRMEEIAKYTQYYDIIIEVKPDHTQAWLEKALTLINYSRTLTKKGKKEEAEKTLKEALKCLKKTTELNPKLAKAWHALGLVYLMLDEEREVERCLGKLAPLDPKLYNDLLIKLMKKWKENEKQTNKTNANNKNIHNKQHTPKTNTPT